MTNYDGRLVRRVVVHKRCHIRTALIDGNLLGEPLGANGFM
jgi:hypothetical protein